ncbi:LTA synthase family protein [Butyrivibrio sp. VCD2006]|uniref:LTA synthase family protein n=1 Tax=Butyrivibrio sp. VCD2006 TaxID=1280664 RepID=UPI0009DB8306|nr:LTA synthase family protein [Butyrivibrio sp. VCD2006]
MKKRNIIKNLILTIILAIPFLLMFTSLWFFNTWNTMTVNELMFNVKMSLSGASHAMIKLFIMRAFLPTCVAALVLFLFLTFVKKEALGGKRVLIAIAASVAALIAALTYTWIQLDMSSYIDQQLHASTFIKDNYADPHEVKIEFPEKKRNLVYIYLESTEVTDTDKEHGGGFEKSRIPELTDLALQNEFFGEGTDKLNGGYSMPGTDWTMGAIFAQSSGLPLQISIDANSMSEQETFFPTVRALGDVLKDEGYHQEYLCGSNATFGGRELFFKTHGDFDIVDYPYAKAQGWIPEDYGVWWGFEDEKLYEYAKNRLTELSKSDEPFNLTLLTVDTHFEDGYVCRLCEDEFDDQYSNVFSCASRQAVEFVNWIQEQDFYENTTIVLVGDHPTMDADFCAMIPEDYTRTVYTCFINPGVSKQLGEKRAYTTFDMYPTTIASLGAKIEGDRLGLGTNLFSSEKTLLEINEMDTMTSELNRKSHFMNELAGITDEMAMEQNYEGASADTDITIDGDVVRVVVSNIKGVVEKIQSIDVVVNVEGNSDNQRTYVMEQNSDGDYVAEIPLEDINPKDTEFNVYCRGALGSDINLFTQRGDMNLKQTDFQEYLEALKSYADSGDYTVFITTRKSGAMRLTGENIEALKALGINGDIPKGQDITLVAAINSELNDSYATKDSVNVKGKVNENLSYHLKGSWDSFNDKDFMLKINGDNIMIERKGLHFAVVNNSNGRIADYVNFDLLDKECRRY